MEEQIIRNIVSQVVENFQTSEQEKLCFPIETSARHVHLTAEAVEKLFGEGEIMQKKRDLSLPGYLAEQRVTIVTAKGAFHNVAVLGPERSAIQVELSKSDARALGIQPPVNISGNLEGAADVYLVGPNGMICAKGSAIVAQAHIHMNQQEADAYSLRDGDTVEVSVLSDRPVVFSNVLIRVAEGMHATMHIDTDEANAGGCVSGTKGIIVGKV